MIASIACLLPWIQTYLSGDTTRCLLFYRNRGRGYSGLGSPFSLFRALLYFRFGVWLRVSPQTAESPLLSRGTFLCGERVVLCSALVFFLVIKSTLPWPSSEGPASIYSGAMGPEHARSASPWPLISMNHPRRKLPVSSVVNLSGEAHWAAVNEQEGTTIFFGGEATAREGTRRRQYVCTLTDTGSVRVHPDRHRVSTYAP